MPGIARGRLADPSRAPASGESVTELARVRNLVVEQILSGELPAPVDYRQDHDEWVAVLHGAARLDVAGESLDLHAGDWVLVPAATPHRLVWAEPGTSWLAVHLFGEGN